MMDDLDGFEDVEHAVSRLTTRAPSFEITWESNDPDNPMNWSAWYRSFIVAIVSFATTCVCVH